MILLVLPFTRARAHLLAVILGLAIAIGPATAHNWFVGHELVAITSGGGFNFYVGNSPSALVGVYPPGISTDPAQEEQDTKRLAETAEGRSLHAGEVSSYWFTRGLHFWREQPIAALKYFGLKCAQFWNNFEIADNYDLEFITNNFLTVLSWPLIGFGGLAAVSLLSLGHGRTLWLLVLAYMGSVVGFYVNDRYRLPVLVFLIPLAAQGLALISRKQIRIKSALAAGGMLFLTTRSLSDPRALEAFNWSTLAALESDAGRDQAAVEAMSKALSANPAATETSAYIKASTAYERLGQLEQAERLLVQATEVHADDGLTFFNLGRFYAEHDKPRAAEANYQRAHRVMPHLPQPFLGLAVLYIHLGDRARAEASVREGLRLSPQNSQLNELRARLKF